MQNKEQIDREEYNKNSPLMENTPHQDIFNHFGIEGNPEESGQHWVIHNNRLLERERFMLNYGGAGRKRVIVDFDPDYFCFVTREEPYTVIDLDDTSIPDMTAEEQEAFREKVLYYTGLDPEKREISIIIPTSTSARKQFTPEEIEADIIEKIRPLIRDLL